MLNAAWHWGRDCSVLNDLLGEPGRTPLYVGLPSTWSSVDGDQMFCRFSWEGSLLGISTDINEWINHWLWRWSFSLYGSSVRGTWRGGGSLLGTLNIMKGRLWRWASLYTGAQLGNLEWTHLPGTLRYGWKGLWRWGVSLCGSSVKETWRRARLSGTLRAGWKGFGGWGISLYRSHGRGLRGSSFTADPGWYAKKVSVYGHLSPWGPLSIWGDPGMWGEGGGLAYQELW